METLKGKNVLIAGASGGIGAATAKLIAGSGARLLITGRNQQRLEELAAEIGINANEVVKADLSKSAEVESLRERFFSTHDSIDILINAAGIGIIKPVEQLTEADFVQTFEANLLAPFLLIKSFLPAMKAAKRGLIVNIPGVLGKAPMAGAAAYTASKFGLTGMMQSIREEVKRTDIRVTNLFLGGVDSAFWDSIDLRVQRDKMIRAEEAAKAIWFLCQQPASGVVSEMALQPFNHQVI